MWWWPSVRVRGVRGGGYNSPFCELFPQRASAVSVSLRAALHSIMADSEVGVCIACFDEEAVGRLRCEKNHFLCDDCVNGLVQSLVGGGELKHRKGGLACVAVDGKHGEACVQSRPTVFERAVVEPILNDVVSKQYLQCLAASNLDKDVAKASEDIQYWVSELLNVTCPNCDDFLDPRPDGCIAMRCPHCCEAFCWLCFESCGTDAHSHALSTHGDYFPPQRVVDSWHRRWRWRRIARLLASDALPSRLPPAAEARDDVTGVGRPAPLVAAQLARLDECRHLLADDEVRLWPFPATEPGVLDPIMRSRLVEAALSGDVGLLDAVYVPAPIEPSPSKSNPCAI